MKYEEHDRRVVALQQAAFAVISQQLNFVKKMTKVSVVPRAGSKSLLFQLGIKENEFMYEEELREQVVFLLSG